jgi:flagellar protein FliO/FliZ
MLRPALTSAGAAVLGCLLLAPAALAAGGERTPLNLTGGEPVHTTGAPAAGGGLVRTIVGLAVVLGVIYGLYWVLKQVRAAREDRASGQGLAPLASLPLGANRSLQLVRAGREIVLVGVGESGVTPIRTYAEAEARALGLIDEDVPEDVELAGAAAPAPAPVAGGLLGRALEDLRRRTVIR